MSLSELKIQKLKPREKRYLVSDGRGLYIAVMPTGEKYWYSRTFENGREHIVPLSEQELNLFKELREFTPHDEYCFVLRGKNKPIGKMSFAKA